MGDGKMNGAATQNDSNKVPSLSTDINVISSEINGYQQMAGQSIFEIGRRLSWVKENDLVHGEWLNWLDSINIEKTFAKRAMKIAKELNGAPGHHLNQLGVKALYEIASLPEEERDKDQVTSAGEIKKPDEMTVRELRDLKKKLHEAQGDLHQVSAENEQLQNQIETHEETIAKQSQKFNELLSKKQEVKEVPGDPVEVEPADYQKIKQDNQKMISEKKQMARQVQAAKNSEQFQMAKVQALQKQLDDTKEGTEEFKTMKKQLQNLQSKYSDASNKLTGVQDYQKVFEAATKLISTVAPIMYSGTLKYVDADSLAAQKADDIANSMIDFGNALHERIPHHGEKQRINIGKDNVIEGDIDEQ